MKAFCVIHEEEEGKLIPATERFVIPWRKEDGAVPLCEQCIREIWKAQTAENAYAAGYAHACGYTN